MAGSTDTSARRALAGRYVMPPLCIFLTLLLFDAMWCGYTTFTPFSRLDTYLSAALAALLLGLPSVLSRRMWPAVAVMLLLDAWSVANLMYYRTYFSSIPLSSYGLASNLSDFLPSVADSLRPADILFPLLTLLLALAWRRMARPALSSRRLRLKPMLSYAALTALPILLLGLRLGGSGGFVRHYAGLKSSAYLHASGEALYTLFGELIYEAAQQNPVLTDAERADTEEWLALRASSAVADSAEVRDNLVIVFAESFESWLIGAEAEGKEITPRLNRLVADTASTFYAPSVLTQVGDGRSIDAQLLVMAGLLPISSGTYSSLYPDNTYLTLPKAMKSIKGARSYLLTVDKLKTWNQGGVARAFGIDTILSYPDFDHTEMFGTRRCLSDGAFVDQVWSRMADGRIWPAGENAIVQMVTYSGHAPFRIPPELATVSFSDEMPEVLRDYLTAAHYTDSALGRLVDSLRCRPDFGRTLVVIIGDHEGLADKRKALLATPQGRALVSPGQYTPFIAVNAPAWAAGRYGRTAGQIDIYPTLLDLMGLRGYGWHGLGRSMLDPEAPGVAVSPKMAAEGNTADTAAVERMRRAWQVSDRIIRFDLLSGRE